MVELLPRPTPSIAQKRYLQDGLTENTKNILDRTFCTHARHCTMTESEAEAVRFTIDHYEPVVERPELQGVYANLMYACDTCNMRKGPRYPSEQMRQEGRRFFKADEDLRAEHFELEGSRVKGKTNVGRYTVDAVDLNRAQLVRLRELRQRLFDDEGWVSEGIQALSSFQSIDWGRS